MLRPSGGLKHLGPLTYFSDINRFKGSALAQYFPGDMAGKPSPEGGESAPISSGSGGDACPPCLVRARVFDWTRSELLKESFDVLLACDVLYQDEAVQPMAELVPR